SYETVSRVDGIRRILSYRTNADLPFATFVGFDKTAVRADAAAHEHQTILVSGGLAMMILFLAGGIRVDLRRRREAELQLADIHHRFEAMARNVPGVLYQRVKTIDGRTRYTYMSEGVRTLLGIEPEAVLSDPRVFLDCIHPDDRDRISAVMRESERTLTP